MDGPVIFMAKGETVHPRLRGNNFFTRYGLLEGYCVIPNKAAYMDNETWAKVAKLVAPGIRKMKGSNIACVLPILFSVYITLRVYPSRLSADDM